jgi:hypothetical protein
MKVAKRENHIARAGTHTALIVLRSPLPLGSTDCCSSCGFINGCFAVQYLYTGIEHKQMKLETVKVIALTDILMPSPCVSPLAIRRISISTGQAIMPVAVKPSRKNWPDPFGAIDIRPKPPVTSRELNVPTIATAVIHSQKPTA